MQGASGSAYRQGYGYTAACWIPLLCSRGHPSSSLPDEFSACTSSKYVPYRIRLRSNLPYHTLQGGSLLPGEDRICLFCRNVCCALRKLYIQLCHRGGIPDGRPYSTAR